MDFVFATLYSTYYRMFFILQHKKNNQEDYQGL